MHRNEPVTVHFRSGAPSAFSWRGRAYHVRAVTGRWSSAATDRIGHPAAPRDMTDELDFWQVQAVLCGGESGVYELRYTSRTGNWHLIPTGSTRHHTE